MSSNPLRLITAVLSLTLTLGPGAPGVARGATAPLPKAVTGSLAVTRIGSGTVTSSPAGIACGARCSASFVGSTNLVLTATPAAGYTFAGWSGACTGIGRCTVKVTGPQGLTATFTAVDRTAPLVSTFVIPAVVNSRAAVQAFSAELFAIDGRMSYLRARAYASVLGAMTTSQQATLAAMKGKRVLAWPQPAQAAVAAVLKRYPDRMMRTYAGELLAWYLGSEDADVYFCPERQGTYFGSFFMKDIKAMHNPSYTIDSNMTANMGKAFLATLASSQRAQITSLVTTQKPDLLAIVAKRAQIAKTLRQFLHQGAVDEASIVNLARQYGELDGEISYEYATSFSAVGNALTTSQQAGLTALRKTATAAAGGSPDYDQQCGNGYLYSAPMPSDAPPLMDTDFLFGACAAQGSTCSTHWDCCSFSCSDNNVCTAPLTFSSTAFQDGGTLPVTYTCEDTKGGVSPPLAWTGAPPGTVEFALTATTLAVDGKKWNWVLYGIPASVTALAANTSGIGTTGASTDGPDLKFYPPCSSGAGLRTDTFTLYALSGKPTFSTSPVSGAVLADAIAALTIGSRQMSVNYTFATGH